MKQVFEVLEKAKALIRDTHVVYTSGKHGSAYFNKDAIYPHTESVSLLCRKIAEHFAKKDVEAVVAPALGGIILSQWVAHHLTALTGREVLGVYAEKEEAGFVIKRGYDKLIHAKKVLVLEDVLTTGGSVKKVVETVRAIGADIVGVGALCNRGGITAAELGGVPELYALFELKLEAWDADDCVLCKKGAPINTEIGKGREFLAQKKR